MRDNKVIIDYQRRDINPKRATAAAMPWLDASNQGWSAKVVLRPGIQETQYKMG